MERIISRMIDPRTPVKVFSPALDRVGASAEKCAQRLAEFTGIIDTSPWPNHITTIFHQKPIVPLWGVARSYHTTLVHTERLGHRRLGYPDSQSGLCEEFFRNHKSQDLFLIKVKGTSLADIEEMPLPLEEDDIRRINRMLRRVRLLGLNLTTLSPADVAVQSAMVILPLQTLARPKEFVFPHNLKPLNDRLTAYFDYYLPFIPTLPSLDDQAANFWSTSFWTGWFFSQALAAFAAARLGLTPSSTMKLYEQSLEPYMMGGKPYLDIVRPAINSAYRLNGLPRALTSYQHTDATNDLLVSQLFGKYYQDKAGSEQERVEELGSIASRVKRYRRPLRAEMAKSTEGYLLISPGSHPLVEHVILASQYPQTLMFIIRLNDGGHLTLEVNGDGNIYGIPLGLKKAIPDIATLLAREIITPTLDLTKQRYPKIEPAVPVIQPLPLPKTFTPLMENLPQRGILPPVFLLREPRLPKHPQTPISLPLPEAASTPDREPFQIAFPDSGALAEKELRQLLQARAHDLARNDGRMEHDLKILIEALRQNPYADSHIIRGTERVFAQGAARKLRSYNGEGVRPKLRHPEGKRVRVIYYLIPEDRTAFIRDIVLHDDFDKMFR